MRPVLPSCQDKDIMRKKSLETNILHEYSAKYPEHRKINSTIYHVKEVISKKAHDDTWTQTNAFDKIQQHFMMETLHKIEIAAI